VVPSLNGADPSFMNSVTGSACRAKCSDILHDSKKVLQHWSEDFLSILLAAKMMGHKNKDITRFEDKTNKWASTNKTKTRRKCKLLLCFSPSQA
jgi:hypothetical protein